ncbi:hypothetical protein GGR54DRAFT_452228 [Hypoxylon sp. NC1633]|nr:hypothetical protein GGR54DRAFT_452228 [Hypoxylon sp. NC1633]
MTYCESCSSASNQELQDLYVEMVPARNRQISFESVYKRADILLRLDLNSSHFIIYPHSLFSSNISTLQQHSIINQHSHISLTTYCTVRKVSNSLRSTKYRSTYSLSHNQAERVLVWYKYSPSQPSRCVSLPFSLLPIRFSLQVRSEHGISSQYLCIHPPPQRMHPKATFNSGKHPRWGTGIIQPGGFTSDGKMPPREETHPGNLSPGRVCSRRCHRCYEPG